MEFTKQENGVILMELTEEDASEAEIAFQIEAIMGLASRLKDKGITAADRAKDRGTYWRYCQLEKALMLIAGSATTALDHIKLIDFPRDIAKQADDRRGDEPNRNH